MSKSNRYFSVFIVLELLLVSGIFVLATLKINNIVSLLFALTFILLAMFIFINGKLNDIKVWFVVLLAVFNVILDSLLQNSNLTFDYMKKVIMFSSFLLMLSLCSQYQVNSFVVKLLKYIPIVLSYYAVASFFILGNTITYAGGITLGLGNPNFTGMWLLHLFVFDAINTIDNNNKPIVRILAAFVGILLVYLIDLTLARASMMGVIAFGILLVIGYLYHKKMPDFVILICVLFPFIFMVLYLSFVGTDWANETFSFLVSEGKSLSSRNAIWLGVLSVYNQSPFIGSYSILSHGTGASQAHNIHLDTLASYGPFVLIMFLGILFFSLRKLNKKVINSVQLGAICAFLAIIVSGTFEAGLVAGAMGLNILTTMLFTLVNSYSLKPLESKQRNHRLSLFRLIPKLTI